MIRRHPPRHRGQHQDFHFFAGTQRPNNFEPRSFAAPQQPATAESPSSAGNQPQGSPTPPAKPTVPPLSPAASSAVHQSIDFLSKIEDPSELIGKPRPAFMDELDALAASRPKASSGSGKQPSSLQPRKRKRAAHPAAVESTPGASHHERRCSICSHPDRADIEADFVEWGAPAKIAKEYGVTRNAVYRHARAAALFARRDRNLRFALGRLIEHADQVWPTPDSIVRAIHAFARINDQGEWIEPPAHVIVSSGGIRREAAAPPSRRPLAIQLDSPALAGVIDVASDPETQRALIGTPQPLESDSNR